MVEKPFSPDWRSPPGETIADVIEERGLKPDEVAAQLGLEPADFGALLAGEARMTEGLAEILSEVLGSTPGFWLYREHRYRELGQKDGYRCPRCGTTSLPPAYRRVIAEFEALSKRERSVARNLLSGLSLYGMPSTPDWPNEIHDALRTLLPSFWDAKDIGDVETLLTTEPDDIEDLEEWS